MNKKIVSEIAIGIILLIAIIIGGAVWLQNRTQVPVAKPVSQTSVSQPADETANWQTYANAKYGFEIKYPTNYSIFQGTDQAKEQTIPADLNSNKIYITDNPKMFFCCEPVYLSVEILDNYVTDFEKWINDKQLFNPENSYRIKSKGYANFEGEQSYQIKAESGIDSPGNIILVNHDSKTYYIRYDDQEVLPLVNQIISTFKFIDSVAYETANWQTYTNIKYGYLVNYPNNWYSYASDAADVFLQQAKEETGNIPGPHADALEIKVKSTSANLSLAQIVKDKYSETGIAFSQEPAYIGGENGLKVTSMCQGIGCGAPEWFVVKNGYLYDFNSNLGYSENFDKIVASFKFTK